MQAEGSIRGIALLEGSHRPTEHIEAPRSDLLPPCLCCSWDPCFWSRHGVRKIAGNTKPRCINDPGRHALRRNFPDELLLSRLSFSMS
jgi:hypothetical protein